MTEATYGLVANSDLLARIPLDARRVLDVGCGAGALGAAFRRRNPAAALIGIEPDPALAALAAPHYDALHRLDVEAVAPPLAPGSLDAMVFGDVLEHLRDPWAVLARDAPLLAPGGVLLACVPNLEHWSFTARLLAGGWRYEEKGLFDRTHLRWFTAEGMRQALEQAGLVPVDVAPRVFDAEKAETLAAALEPALAALGTTPADWLRRAAPLQYVWRATPRAPRRLFLAARTLKPVGGVNDVRVLQPMRALASQPGVRVEVSQSGDLPAPRAGLPHVLILQRRLLDSPQAVAYLKAARATGALLVQEFDDDPAHWPSIARNGNLAFSGVHAVQTSTEPLRALFAAWNPEVAVFPNTLAELPEPANFRDPGRLTLFFGALNREADIAPFLPALNQALAEADGRLAVEVVHDRTSHAALATPHKRFTPTADYAGYRAVLARCELAFLPLADTRFNRMKSDLKAVEAGGHRLCCLASPVVYAGTLRHGETGLILPTPEALLAALRSLLADRGRALAMAEAARAWVRSERLLAQQLGLRRAWYDSLWQRRAALDAALLRRVPQLA
ncbi:methyltransferase domain-containing protein [Falsiroseomonas selenitidurans]|uniref:Class I SAM-dependent methyltransferase n=1 Tax=Falsiroseomonas selenitidurans TaxID=2716335 RepID=A0ABX1E0M0_9PROT|nr:methyltransferase domain-containing protein [Falsiroseomonas selenitidurans]NKC29307.1 class I SAM-dependent methyltransferase [Falsiroseomonas selenitidurans]